MSVAAGKLSDHTARHHRRCVVGETITRWDRRLSLLSGRWPQRLALHRSMIVARLDAGDRRKRLNTEIEILTKLSPYPEEQELMRTQVRDSINDLENFKQNRKYYSKWFLGLFSVASLYLALMAFR